MAAFAAEGFALQGLKERRAEARKIQPATAKRGSEESLSHKKFLHSGKHFPESAAPKSGKIPSG
jgi:hypothetical protein